MPIYEYTCKSCKSQFEKLAKSMSSSAGVKCPNAARPRRPAISAFSPSLPNPNPLLPNPACAADAAGPGRAG